MGSTLHNYLLVTCVRCSADLCVSGAREGAGWPGGAGTVLKGEMPRALEVLPARRKRPTERSAGYLNHSVM